LGGRRTVTEYIGHWRGKRHIMARLFERIVVAVVFLAALNLLARSL
jgi:hypothetical protein